MTICANNFAFLYLIFNTIKTYGSPKTAYGKEFVILVFVMKIKNNRIGNPAITTPPFLFELIKPLMVAAYKGLFCQPVAMATFPTAIYFCLRCESNAERIFRIHI